MNDPAHKVPLCCLRSVFLRHVGGLVIPVGDAKTLFDDLAVQVERAKATDRNGAAVLASLDGIAGDVLILQRKRGAPAAAVVLAFGILAELRALGRVNAL